MPDASEPIRLSPETLDAFAAYVHNAESDLRSTESADSTFLWTAADLKRATELAKGKILAQFWSGNKPIHVPQGLIHDWIAAALIPKSKLSDVLDVIQSYDNHKNIYKPDVLDSKLVSRDGNDFRIFLRLLKKKVISVVLDTEHEVHYARVCETRWTCRSHTTSISEVQNAGTKDQTILAPDTGYGFLWRLNTYWRFEQQSDDVGIECRAISLTRDVPKGLAWIIDPIVGKLPKESLINTLKATRVAVLALQSVLS